MIGYPTQNCDFGGNWERIESFKMFGGTPLSKYCGNWERIESSNLIFDAANANSLVATGKELKEMGFRVLAREACGGWQLGKN